MPQDPNLYGRPPPKKQRRELAISGSLDFTSQLSSLLAAQTSTTPTTSSTSSAIGPAVVPARPRASKLKSGDLSSVKVKRKHQDNTETQSANKLTLKDPVGTEDEKAEREHARRRMESKARLYAAMQRGDYIGREIGLVDFDRKWAESKDKKNGGAADSSSSDLDSSSSDNEAGDAQDPNIDTELVEYEDEFGRLRRGTRAEKLRYERRIARGHASTAELDRMSARPRAPENIILGDAVQAEAFVVRDEQAMEELARKRDRSATPPPAEHYRADREIRTKGVGFYAFSRDEEVRTKEMQALEAERARTEALRKEREDKAAARRKEIEARRRELEERRAKKMADSFLDGLGKDLLTHDREGGGSGERT
ncbi:hypothetical protein QBC47DRAFT_315965 [Echria macrotheca]|uniref:Uncharacterized protein n=1 Tax=Echria macrotheca TaxID=438768 RepID=A0AAJ0BJN9_9PEZI|nr:hypothetical protein QBC47DRAFT_315965 [Echria macrotheca]